MFPSFSVLPQSPRLPLPQLCWHWVCGHGLFPTPLLGPSQGQGLCLVLVAGYRTVGIFTNAQFPFSSAPPLDPRPLQQKPFLSTHVKY